MQDESATSSKIVDKKVEKVRKFSDFTKSNIFYVYLKFKSKIVESSKEPILRVKIKKEKNSNFFECKLCDKTYKKIGFMQAHMRAKHGRKTCYKKKKYYNIRSSTKLKSKRNKNLVLSKEPRCSLCE